MSVSYLMVLQFIVVIFYLNLLVLIAGKGLRDRLNLVFALFTGSFLCWGVTMIFTASPTISEAAAVLACKIGSFGWISFPSFFIWLVFVFTEKKNILEKKIFYIIIFLLPLVLIARQWVDPFLLHPRKDSNGWAISWDGSFWTYGFLLYFSVFTLGSLYLLYKHSRQTKDQWLKKQTLTIIFSSLISLILGTISDILFPLLTGKSMPSVGNIFFIILALGIFYAITKYKLLNLTFSLASKNIISTISDSLLLLNTEGRIIDINDRAMHFLQFEKKEMLNKNLTEYFSAEISPEIIRSIKDENKIDKLDTKIRLKDGTFAPVLFSGSPIKNEDNNFSGWVCVVSDISYQKKAEAALLSKNNELQEKLAELEKFQKIVVDRELKMIELKTEISRLQKKMSAD